MKKIRVTEFAKMVGVSRQNISYYINKNKDKGCLEYKGKSYPFEILEFGDEKRILITVDEDEEGQS